MFVFFFNDTATTEIYTLSLHVALPISKRIQQISGEVLQVQQGSLYPALHRLEQQAWIKAHWAETETGRKAKVYALTSAGRTQLGKELASWDRLARAVRRGLPPAREGDGHAPGGHAPPSDPAPV